MENTADSSPEARVMLSANPVSTHASSLLSSPSKANDLKGDDAKEVALLDSDTDEEDDQYILVENERRRPKVTERSRLNAAIFQKWLDNHQNEVTKPNAQRRPGDLDSHSIAQLLGEFSNEKIITSPREYQIELFEKAKEKNIIVVLDTGSGKTLISALLLRHILDQELEDRSNGQSRRVAFFVVEKVGLCFQQHKVLSDNLEHKITKVYGNMPGFASTSAFWDAQITENMAIVCTAQVLLDCLNNGFVRIRDINLLIFDEAHHTKKSHPYARIVKSHYMWEPDPQNRPRILGMTASPVDAQTKDVKLAAAELESMLCSEIATVSNEIMLRNLQQRMLEETNCVYERLVSPDETCTALWEELNDQVSDNLQFRAHFDHSKEASSVLGRWCADRYWSLLMTEAETSRLVSQTEEDLQSGFGYSGHVERAVNSIWQIPAVLKRYPLATASRGTGVLSSKVERLIEVIEESFCKRGASRCMVFVKKRYTASLLADLFQQPGIQIPGVMASYLIGTQSVSSTLANMSLREQVLTLQKFRNGEFNCLFATSVAEEGIDVPECDLIIRFDLYDTVIQYIQSKGRARQVRSRYINMIEEGNLREIRRIRQTDRDSIALKNFCAAVPEDRKVQDCIVDAAAVAEAERLTQKIYEVSSTGARLSLQNSMEVLAKFVSSFSSESSSSLVPEYAVISEGRKFSADVILPEVCPVNCVSGFPQRSKQLAKYSAAFEACMMLLEKNYLNDNLQPVFVKKLPAMRNARLAVSSRKKAEYAMRVKPNVWSQVGAWNGVDIFPVALILENPDAFGRPSRPLILLCRQRLPAIPPVPLFFGKNTKSMAKVVASKTEISLSEFQVDALTVFTLRVYQDVFSKWYEATSEDMPYLLAPSADSHNMVLKTGDVNIDWNLTESIHNKGQEYLDWQNQPENFFTDRFVVDPVDGSRKMFTHVVNANLSPNDSIPIDCADPTVKHGKMAGKTIKQYSSAFQSKARREKQWSENQPVIEAELLSLRRNFLDPHYPEETSDNMKCYIIPEPLFISPIPVDVVTMALLFPAVLHRMDSCLIASDACFFLGLDIRQDLALEALTKDSDNSEEHGEEQINLQAGMGNNYERLEFLGDTFLKMATTIAGFTQKPKMDEFEGHVWRMLLLCNQNLFNHAVDRGLQEYIRSKAFDRRSWYPDLKMLRGKRPKTSFVHSLSDKSIADVCEALIGAAYLSHDTMDMAVKAVTVMVNSKKHKMEAFEEYYALFKMPQWQAANEVSAVQRAAVDKVHQKIGYKFQSPTLLRSAFKHPSYPYEHNIPNYQRLEFLGDSLLDMVIVDHLFKTFPTADPQWLTEHKMAMVSNQFQSFLCVELGLHKHLLSTTASLIGDVSKFASSIEQAKEVAAEQAGGDESINTTDSFWLEVPDPPKALADTIEALVGAMFVDSKYDYGVVQRFFRCFIAPYFRDMSLYDTFASKHPVTKLARRLQEDFGCNDWRLCVEARPCGADEGAKAITKENIICGLLVHRQVVALATSESERYGKVAAAKQGFKKFEGMDKDAFKAETGCDCGDTKTSENEPN